MSDKPKFPRALAIQAARQILPILETACERIVIAGSLRRRKSEVGDIEILYVPINEFRPLPGDMFASHRVNLADLAISAMIRDGILEIRTGPAGGTAYGTQNKLMRHIGTGIPVDLFATSQTSWHNYLVCRTGPKESNIAISEAANAKGWRWNPYGSGFNGPGGEHHAVTSERDVFDFVGLPYLEPWER